MLIDTHCHLGEEENDNFEKLMNNILISDLKYIVVSGYDLESSVKAVELAHKYDNVYATVGFHPHDSKNVNDSDYEMFDSWLLDNKVVGVGEIGLDYYYDTEIKSEQIKMFKRQIEIAIKYNKPIVVHNRDASNDIYNILRGYNAKGIIHCFNDDIEIARKFIDIGFLLGIGGIITFKNNKNSEIIKKLPLESIVLETDSPYLSPEPFRGKENTPLNLPIIASAISKIIGIEYNIVASSTTSNACRLFVFEAKL